jgi:hypothetical protein
VEILALYQQTGSEILVVLFVVLRHDRRKIAHFNVTHQPNHERDSKSLKLGSRRITNSYRQEVTGQDKFCKIKIEF